MSGPHLPHVWLQCQVFSVTATGRQKTCCLPCEARSRHLWLTVQCSPLPIPEQI